MYLEYLKPGHIYKHKNQFAYLISIQKLKTKKFSIVWLLKDQIVEYFYLEIDLLTLDLEEIC
jgi:hypothetical protein